MSPELSKPIRSFEEAIADQIASMPDPHRVAAEADARKYRREVHLERLGIGFWPEQIEDRSIGGTKLIIEKLAARCSTLRRMADHWSYSLPEHIAVLAALIAERKFLAELIANENAKGFARIFSEAAE